MKINQYWEQNGYRFEITLQPKTLETVSAMQTLTEEQKREVRSFLVSAATYLVEQLEGNKINELDRPGS